MKGSSTVIKRGSLFKNIRLQEDDDEHVECRNDKIKGLMLKTCFLKKV